MNTESAQTPEQIQLKREQSRVKREVTRRNKLWTNATPEQRRVMVAKDVLQQLKVGKLIAFNGQFFQFDNVAQINDDMQTTLISKKVSCQVCALGSLAISHIMFANKVKYNQLCEFSFLGDPLVRSISFPNEFEKLFEPIQFVMIENAYECGAGYFAHRIGKTETYTNLDYNTLFTLMNRAKRFGDKYPNNTDRMIAIMKNIIKNNGKFVP